MPLMNIVHCPYCQGEIQSLPALVGKQVLCPHCRQQMQMPGGVSVSGQLLPQEPEPPPFLVRSQPHVVFVTHSQPRLRSSGWFSRGFSSASGVLLAIALFLTAMIGVPMFLMCGGFMTTASRVVSEANDRREQLTANAKKISEPHLARFGVVQIAEGAVAFERAGDVYFAGTGKDSSGRLRKFHVGFTVATFAKKTTWELQTIVIDGEMTYRRPE